MQPREILNKLPANQLKTDFHTYKTGSMWIDPKTHHIIRRVSDGVTIQSDAIYAVGAMTRGQIIDTSMAYGIVRSTDRIAKNLVDCLGQVKMRSNC